MRVQNLWKYQKMNKESKEEYNKRLVNMMFEGHFKYTVITIILVVLPILVFGGATYILDKQLNTFPALFIIGLLAAFVTTPILIINIFKKLTKQK